MEMINVEKLMTDYFYFYILESDNNEIQDYLIKCLFPIH